jgi:GMP synthase (glutamine-hydrolysing)
LCSKDGGVAEKLADGWKLPVQSVGVQGDSRTYRSALAVADFPASDDETASLINRMDDINRVVVSIWTAADIGTMQSVPSFLTAERIERLRHADGIVRRLTLESGFDNDVWQFPVVLIPFGTPGRPDSVVLRPIYSVDGMTASMVRMPAELLAKLVAELREQTDIAGVFYDITNKPPGTIEWE